MCRISMSWMRGLNFNKKDSERREVGLIHYYKRLEDCVT